MNNQFSTFDPEFHKNTRISADNIPQQKEAGLKFPEQI